MADGDEVVESWRSWRRQPCLGELKRRDGLFGYSIGEGELWLVTLIVSW